MQCAGMPRGGYRGKVQGASVDAVKQPYASRQTPLQRDFLTGNRQPEFMRLLGAANDNSFRRACLSAHMMCPPYLMIMYFVK